MGIDLSRAKPQTNENAVIAPAPVEPVQPEAGSYTHLTLPTT